MTVNLSLILVFSLFAFGLGSPDCSYRRKCQDLWTAKECNAVKECIPLWSWRVPTGNRDDVCNICLQMVKEARDALRSNETREELREVFEGSCQLLVLKPAVKLCDKLVDQFVSELVDILSSQMDPEAVCSVARLCNNEEFRKALLNSADCNDCKQFFYASDVIMRRVSPDDYRNGLLDVCRTAGGYSDACSHLAITHAGFLHKSVNSLLKKKICNATLLCPSMAYEPAQTPQRNVIRLNEMCPLCKTVMPNVRKQLLKVRSAEAFADNMLRICDELNLSNSTCPQLSKPEFYENLKKSEALPDLFCRATYCKEKRKGDTPVWPLVSTTDRDLETDFLEFLALSDVLYEQNQHAESHPKIAYGDPIENPVVFSPGLTVGKFEQKQRTEAHPKIAFGDPIENPTFFGPDLTSKFYETDSEECETCSDVFDLLSRPARNDEEYLSKFLDVVCVMSKNTKKCERFMAKYMPFVQAAFTDGGVSQEMCGHLPSCQAKGIQPAVPEKCSLCLNVVRILKDGNSSLMSPSLQQKCNGLPDVPSHICRDLSSTFDSLSSLLQISTENEACSSLNLCPASPLKTQALSKPTCQTCMLTIQTLVDTLESNSSNKVIEHALNQMCNLLPHVEKRLCHNLINVIGVEGFRKLLESVDPTQICRELHMCKKKEEPYRTTTVVTEPSTSKAVTRTPSQVEKVPCKFCMMAINMLLDQLQDDTTEEAIRKALDNLCHYFPEETRDTCQNLINQYADRIIDMIIADFNATEICTFLKICPDKHLFGADGHDQRAMEKNFDVNTNEVRDLEEMESHETLMVPEHVEEAFQGFQKMVQECAMCEALVGVISSHKKMLDKNYDFASNAYKICSIVPRDKIQMCMSMLVSYGPSIVNLLLDHKVDPNEVCVYLAICDPKLRARVNQPVSVPEPDAISEEKNDCLLGPVFWCANAGNAEKCGTFLHCQETVWKSWKSPPTRHSDNL